MNGKVGDNLTISNFSLAGMPIHDPACAYLNGIVFKNSITSPFGEMCKVRIIDDKNEVGRKFQLDGNKALSEPVTISMSVPFTGATMDRQFKILKHLNLEDGTTKNVGNNRHKSHEFLLVREEFINAQSNRANFSSREPATQQMKKILEEYYKTSSPVNILTESKGPLRHISTGHPVNEISKLLNRSVGPDPNNNCFMCFHDGNPNGSWTIGTMNDILNNAENVATYNQSMTLASGATQDEIYYSLMNANINKLFDTSYVHNFNGHARSYNFTTGRAASAQEEPKDDYNVPNSQKIIGRDPNNNGTTVFKRPYQATINDPVNNKEAGAKGIAETRRNRNAEWSQYFQNSGTVKMHSNPDLLVGKKIKLDLPDKSDEGSSSGEPQFNGECLIIEAVNYVYPTGIKPGGITQCKVITGGKNRG